MLGHPTGLTDRGQIRGVQAGLLARELIRQAMLVVARDEPGLHGRALADLVNGAVPAR
jgi:hypothetical protein